MRILSHIAAATAAGILAVLGAGFANVAHAETHIGGLVTSDVHFTLADSPVYLTAELAVQDGHTVTVDPGVIIDADPRAQYSGFDIERSGLIIKGTPEQPVVIRNIKRIYTNWSTVDISHADIHTEGSALQLYNSSSTLDHIFIDGEISPPIYSVNSALSISDSRFTNNRFIGIYIAPGANSRGPVRVHNSSITGNGNNALMNASMITVEAENNWWGTPEGPSTTGENSVVGYVHTSPWLTEPPLALEPPQGQLKTCCSSVLFIPGLQGTRLYDSIDWPLGLGSTPYKDWEPVWNGDVKNLYLDQTGSSTKNVYSTDPIDTVFGMTDIYGKFMDFLGSLVSGGEIQEWRAFGYDWRKPIAEVVAGPERKSTTTESLIETVTRMASSSKTGKVSIVAHSNGGLVAKYLLKTLSDLGKSNLIDQVISVAVPYLGTPEAIAGLLHGDNQSIAAGFVTSASVARGLGLNMPSAYSLLPSATYLMKSLGPTIVFASTTIPGLNDGTYPQAITAPIEQVSFVGDFNNIRTAPSATDTAAPIKGNRMLLIAADALHTALDSFIWPANVLRYAIIGTGADTTSAISYAERMSCLISYIGLPCHETLSHTLRTTTDGDGTVVSSSADFNSGTSTYMDLQKISDKEGRTLRHANILESSTTESLIGTMLTKKALPSVLPSGVSLTAVTKGGRSLVISTHSPVDLHVYDAADRHTGPVVKPASLGNNEFITSAYEEQIPGSSFDVHDAEDGRESSVRLPDDSASYTIRVDGTNLGFATLDIEQVRGTNVEGSIEYSMFPVTPFAEASTTLTHVAGAQADDTSTLSLNLGDGQIQALVPNAGALPGQTAGLETIKTFVRLLGADDPHVVQLTQRLDHLEDLLLKGKLKQASHQAASFDIELGHMKLASLTPENRDKILASIDAGLKTIEDAQ